MYGQHTRLENEILNKILSYHFFVESYTFFCIFCQARPRVSDCVFHAIPTQRHATVTVGPEDEAGTKSRTFFFILLYWPEGASCGGIRDHTSLLVSLAGPKSRYGECNGIPLMPNCSKC